MAAGLIQVDSLQTSPFGQIKTVSPTTLFGIAHEYTPHPLLWTQALSGTGAIAHSTATNSLTLTNGGTAAGARAMRQTKVYWRYQYGKAQTAKLTGVPRLSGTGGKPFFFIRSNTSGSVVEQRAYQDKAPGITQWSEYPKDPGSIARNRINENASIIPLIDFQWLGVGIVRCGFQFGDTVRWAHKFLNAGTVTEPFMRTANLPLRYEVINAADGKTYALMGYFDDDNGVGFGLELPTYTNITLRQICCCVESEGGVQNEAAYPFCASNKGTLVTCADSTTLTPVMTVRLRDTFGGLTYRGHVHFGTLSWLNTSNAPAYFEILWNVATLTSASGATNELTGGTWTSVDATYSGVERNVAATAYTGGIMVGCGYVPSAGVGTGVKPTVQIDAPELLILAREYNNTRDTLTIAARGIGGSVALGVSMPFGEQY